MAEFEDKLNSILSNQEAMGQIMSLAKSLSGSSENRGEEPPQAQDPGPEPPPDPAGLPGGLDPRLIRLGTRLLREYQGGEDNSTALLLALRPFLREERRARLDQAVQIARVARAVRLGLELLGQTGGDDHV